MPRRRITSGPGKVAAMPPTKVPTTMASGVLAAMYFSVIPAP